MRQGWWPLALWTGLIVLLVAPWTMYQNHVHWQRVAWIRIPRQVVAPFRADVLIGDERPDTPEAQLEDVGENLSFNPWNSQAAHEPLGSINRGRRRANSASAVFRHARNNRSLEPPGVDAIDALAAATLLNPGSVDPKPEPDPFTFGSRWAYFYLRRVPRLHPARAEELAEIVAPVFARRMNVRFKGEARRFLEVLYFRARERTAA